MEQIIGTLASSNPLQKVKSGTQTIANSAFVAVTGIDPQAIGLVEVEYIGASAKFSFAFRIASDDGTTFTVQGVQAAGAVVTATSDIRNDISWRANTIAFSFNTGLNPTSISLYAAGADFSGGTVDVKWVQTCFRA